MINGVLKLEYPETKALLVWQYKGTICSIVRHEFGHLCGYTRIAAGFNNEVEDRAEVHGGITFAQVQDDGSTVYGFDCAHAGDAPPEAFCRPYLQRLYNEGDHVWAVEETKAETERMVDSIQSILSGTQ